MITTKLELLPWAKLLIVILLMIVCCMSTLGYANASSKSTTNHQMQTYYIGRFSIAVPDKMPEAPGSRTHKLRYVEIVEVKWPNKANNNNSRETEWNKYISHIRKPTFLKTSNEIIIKTQDFSGLGKWAKGVFHYSPTSARTATWAFLMDTGTIGLWIKTRPVVVEKENTSHKSINNLVNISKHYIEAKTPNPTGNCFFLKHGAISLPYSAQEKTYIRFEGHPLDLKLEVEMDMDANYKRPQHGLMHKVSSAIASGFASAANVSVKKIRSHKREVAGMPGEEVISRLTDKDEKTLSFGWEYVGKDDSGEYPTTRITMESPDGNLDEKLKIWDAILDSMHPMFERKN